MSRFITRHPNGKHNVSLRQRLHDTGEVEEFCSELAELLEQEAHAGNTATFEDFDISQNRIPGECFEEIFMHLTIAEASVFRFKAFGCPALGDAAISMLAGWLSSAKPGALPSEVHLSDCAITGEGFEAMVEAFRNSAALPAQDRYNPDRTVPIYVRVENNYIDEAILQAAIDEGVMVKWKKGDSMPQDPTIKGRLVVWDRAKFAQKKGAPPDPTLVPEPAKVGPPAQTGSSWVPRVRAKAPEQPKAKAKAPVQLGKDTVPLRLRMQPAPKLPGWEGKAPAPAPAPKEAPKPMAKVAAKLLQPSNLLAKAAKSKPAVSPKAAGPKTAPKPPSGPPPWSRPTTSTTTKPTSSTAGAQPVFPGVGVKRVGAAHSQSPIGSKAAPSSSQDPPTKRPRVLTPSASAQPQRLWL